MKLEEQREQLVGLLHWLHYDGQGRQTEPFWYREAGQLVVQVDWWRM